MIQYNTILYIVGLAALKLMSIAFSVVCKWFSVMLCTAMCKQVEMLPQIESESLCDPRTQLVLTYCTLKCTHAVNIIHVHVHVV